jgi:hypothetical protein
MLKIKYFNRYRYFHTPIDFLTKISGFFNILFLLSLISFSLTAQYESIQGSPYPGQKIQTTSILTRQSGQELKETEPSLSLINGLFWQFSIGTLAGNKNKQDMNGVPGIMMMTSYRFNRRISFGIGLGIEVMEYTAAPFYADFKLHLPVNRPYSPYLYGNAGKSMPLGKPPESFGIHNKYTGGFMSGVGAGIFLPGGEDFGWYFQAGFRYNELRTELSHGWVYWQSEIIHYYHRLELRLGVFFN